MKRLILLMISVAGFLPVFSQGWVVVNGTVTDSLSGSPIEFHKVTVMTDSTSGTFYFNIVETDAQGYYVDELPVMGDTAWTILISVVDCRDITHVETIVYNPGINTYTRDFEICTLNTPLCEAFFVYSQEPAVPPDSFIFTDLSSGNIIAWSWSFGDGTSSTEQNPVHSFPGPGTFTTCLTIEGNNCTDTYCQEIIISDTVYRQIYGQVFAGNFPMQQGIVRMFSINPNGAYTPLDEGSPVDSNGIYYFTLVPEGVYIIQAVPYDTSAFLPTYLNYTTIWQNATQVVVAEPQNPYNINLVEIPAWVEVFGSGSLTGQINNLGMNRSNAENASVFLLDENLSTLGFTMVNSSGQFEFPSLDYGVYNIRVELAGVRSDNMKFEISPEEPHVEVVLNYTGNSVLGIDDVDAEVSVLIYPVPANDRLNVDINLDSGQALLVRMFSMAGECIYQQSYSSGRGDSSIIIPVNNFSPGIFCLELSGDHGFVFREKVVISH
jgi:PKD repeat protein